MKIVKNHEELRRDALSRGATVSIGGRQFNTTGEQVTPVAMPQRAPKPAAESSAPAVVQEPAQVTPEPKAAVQVDLAPVAQAQRDVGQMLAMALASLPRPAEPITRWTFDVERDDNGYLKTLTATAVE